MQNHLARSVHRAATASAAFAGIALACGALATGAEAKTMTKKHPAKKTMATKITPSTPVTRGSGYLALGDSVTFGYREPTVTPTPDFADAASFVGYPEMLGNELHLKVANLACPGETSGSLINAGAQSNGCENSATPGSPAYRTLFPLHVKYTGSQLNAAVKYLKANSNVRLVSLMIGANDFYACEALTADHCASQSEQLNVVQTVQQNVHKIISTIRNKAKYNGQIVLLNYYSTDYASPLADAQSQTLNQFMDRGGNGFHVRIASGYNAFAAASVDAGGNPCTAVLLTQLSTGGCGVHPTYAGQSLLASAVLTRVKVG